MEHGPKKSYGLTKHHYGCVKKSCQDIHTREDLGKKKKL